MEYRYIGKSGLRVTPICMGTMSFGSWSDKKESFKILDTAYDRGINFFDTAELYSVPARAETYGATEKIIGTWLKKTGNRDKVVIGSKIAGSGAYTAHIRGNGFAKEAIISAVEGSLKRLQTDYIDLYQLHWPERGVNCFGVRDYPYKTATKEAENHLEILETLSELIKQGKIRSAGLSNETPWGTMQYLQTAKDHNLPRMSTIQNSYSLIHRAYEYGMSEVSLRENIGLLVYSPLGFGVLSGKYLNGKMPADSRVKLYPNYNRYSSAQSERAVMEYQKLAHKHGMTLAEMSLAFVNQLPFVTSNIIGASKLSQLKENIGSIHIDLSDDIISEINRIHTVMPNPAP